MSVKTDLKKRRTSTEVPLEAASAESAVIAKEESIVACFNYAALRSTSKKLSTALKKLIEAFAPDCCIYVVYFCNWVGE